MAEKPSTIRQKLARAAADRTHLPDPEDATEVLGEVDTTQPVEQRPHGAPLVPARLNHDHVDQRAADLAMKVARVAEHARFAAGYSADVTHTANLLDLLSRAGDAQSDRELVAADLIGQVASEVEAWAKDRGTS